MPIGNHMQETLAKTFIPHPSSSIQADHQKDMSFQATPIKSLRTPASDYNNKNNSTLIITLILTNISWKVSSKLIPPYLNKIHTGIQLTLL